MSQGNAGKGRPKGSTNKRTTELLAHYKATGIVPLDYMVSILQNVDASPDDRKWAAERSAPYIHPKPLPQPRCVQVELPDTSAPVGIAEAIGAVLTATAKGQIAPSEGRDLVGLIEARLKAFEAIEIDERISKLEERDSK